MLKSKNNIKKMMMAHSIFDKKFYESIYKNNIKQNIDPIDHFLNEGIDIGFLPSQNCDYTLFKFMFPNLSVEDHTLLMVNKKIKIDHVLYNDPIFQKLIKFKKLRNKKRIPNKGKDSSLNAKSAVGFSKERLLNISKNIKIKIPESNFFINKIKNNEPFTFARIPHGFWDSLIIRDKIQSIIEEDGRSKSLNQYELKMLSARIALKLQPFNGAYTELFIDEVLEVVDRNCAYENHFLSIAFNGYPTWDEQTFMGSHDQEMVQERIKLIKTFFPGRDYFYDARQWKRLLLSGDLKNFPEYCRDKHVILVASKLFSELGARWKLDSFSHIQIPIELSQWHRWRLLKLIENEIKKTNKCSVVLTQCGGSLAFWLFNRLFSKHSDAFFIDFGQALNGWFLDKNLPVFEWMRIYQKSIIINNRLEDFYKKIIGNKYQDWYNRLDD